MTDTTTEVREHYSGMGFTDRMNPAHRPDFAFNTIFALLTTAAVMPVVGIIFARLQSRI